MGLERATTASFCRDGLYLPRSIFSKEMPLGSLLVATIDHMNGCKTR
jgi:hypothetical protein